MAKNQISNRIKQVLGGLLLIFFLYLAIVIAHGTIYDYQPEDQVKLDVSPCDRSLFYKV